jgi:hypothetical protein
VLSTASQWSTCQLNRLQPTILAHRNGDKAIDGVLVAYKLVRTGCRSARIHSDIIEILSLHLAGLKELASLQR